MRLLVCGCKVRQAIGVRVSSVCVFKISLNNVTCALHYISLMKTKLQSFCQESLKLILSPVFFLKEKASELVSWA